MLQKQPIRHLWEHSVVDLEVLQLFDWIHRQSVMDLVTVGYWFLD